MKDQGTYTELMNQLKDKFSDNLGHIFIDEILVVQDTEFEVKPPKGRSGEDPTEEQNEKFEQKKKKAWKFQMKKLPEIFADVLDTKKEFMLVVRQNLVKDLSEEQVLAHLYTELRKINTEYKLGKPDLHTFSDLVKLLGRPDWDQAFGIPNILEV
ncbi:MAG: hypothetical protein K0R18_185 [Bacillales bacterium]|jgi:hypothetical protein|nr:hypothetical protein [Bacillales bacterium]